MRISVSEWTTLRLALKLPRAILNPELLAPALRRHGSTRRGQAAIGAVLLAVLVFLHVNTADLTGNVANSAMTWGVVVRDGLAYVNDMNNGLWIVRMGPVPKKAVAQ